MRTALLINLALTTFVAASPQPLLFYESISPAPSFSGMNFGDMISISSTGLLAVRSYARPSNRTFPERVLSLYSPATLLSNDSGWAPAGRIVVDKPNGANFASSFSFLNSTTLLVGAGGVDTNIPGDIFIFTAPDVGLQWTLTQTISSPETDFMNSGLRIKLTSFGSAMAINENVVVVASLNEAVAIFQISSGSIDDSNPDIIYSPSPNIDFGASVALSSSLIAIGAPRGADGVGSVYFLYSDGDDDQTFHTFACPDLTLKRFGYKLHLTDTQLLVSAISGRTGEGVVLLFTLDSSAGNSFGNSFSFVKQLTASDGTKGNDFGAMLSTLDDNTVLVGAPSSNAGNQQTGSVYAFRQGRFMWSQVAKITSPSAISATDFGVSFAELDGTLFVGADLTYDTGIVLIDEWSISTLPQASDDIHESEDGPSYGDKGAFWDSATHIIVSMLLFVIVPSLGVATGVYYRKDIGDFVSKPDWRFRVVGNGSPDDNDQPIKTRRVFAQEKVPLTAIAEEEGLSTIRV